MFQIKVVENTKRHNLCSTTFFFFFGNRSTYEIMWKNIVQPDRPQMTIWRMCIACCIPKATDTQSEYVNTYGFSTARMVVRTRLNVPLYVHCLSCWYWTACSLVGVYRRFRVTCCTTGFSDSGYCSLTVWRLLSSGMRHSVLQYIYAD